MKDNTYKSTILIITIGFQIVYLVFSVNWALFVSLGIGILGAISPFIGRKIEWIWMKLAHILGYIIPNILLSIVFYFILFPISLISKLNRKDLMMLAKTHRSLFTEVDRVIDKSSFERPW